MQTTPQKKLKIALLLDDTLDVNDGVQQYVRTIGKWLAAQGHEVHYVVGYSHKNTKHIHSMTNLVSVRFNANTVRTPLPARSRTIANLLQRHDFDILHVQMPYSPFMAHRVLMSPLHSAALVGTFHIMPYSVAERWATKLLGAALRRSIRKIHTVLAVSTPAAALAEKAFGRSAKVVPNAVDIKKFTKKSPKRLLPKKYVNVVFLGRLVARKGCMHLLKALVRLQQENKLQSVRITVCGDGPDRARLETYVVHNNLSAVVRFAGFIAEADKPAYLRDADIAVFPSTSGESFGIVLIEAMAAGSSVVLAGDNPGYRSVMKGLESQIINPRDTTEFAAALLQHIQDSEGRRRIQLLQKNHVQQYDSSAVGAAIEAIYYEAIAKKQNLPDNTT